MGEKDITEKTLEECNDVFADIVNVLLFDGDEVIDQDVLAEGSPYSNYIESGKVRSQERDIYKYWENSQIRLAAIGFENETTDEPDMPLRIINYDAAGYRAQLVSRNDNSKVAPDDRITHVQELLSLMSALTGDSRFVDTYTEIKGKERISMCTVLDEIEAKGIKIGMAQGFEQGIEQGRENTLISLVHDGLLSIETASDRANMSVKEFETLMNKYYAEKTADQ